MSEWINAGFLVAAIFGASWNLAMLAKESSFSKQNVEGGSD